MQNLYHQPYHYGEGGFPRLFYRCALQRENLFLPPYNPTEPLLQHGAHLIETD